MYKVRISGEIVEIEAQGLSVDNGNLLFFRDIENKLVHNLIPCGKWEMLEITEESSALQIGSTEKIHVREEAEASEGVREQDAEVEEAAEKGEEKEADQA